jgi:hypothetical protein
VFISFLSSRLLLLWSSHMTLLYRLYSLLYFAVCFICFILSILMHAILPYSVFGFRCIRKVAKSDF